MLPRHSLFATDELNIVPMSLSDKRLTLYHSLIAFYQQKKCLDDVLHAEIIKRLHQTPKKILPQAVKVISSQDKTQCIANHQQVFFNLANRHAVGYAAKESSIPAFAVKAVRSSFIAHREIKTAHLLNRTSAFWFFNHDDAMAVLPWIPGRTLEDYAALELHNEITAYTMLHRLRCLHMLLDELNTLHANLRSHNDLLMKNIIIDLDRCHMHIIDFDEACKIIDPTSFSGDMINVGNVIKLLYPELNMRDNIRLIHQALLRLLEATKHCSSEQAMQFCAALLLAGEGLTQAKLEHITNSTIMRTELTLEDKLRSASSFKKQ